MNLNLRSLFDYYKKQRNNIIMYYNGGSITPNGNKIQIDNSTKEVISLNNESGNSVLLTTCFILTSLSLKMLPKFISESDKYDFKSYLVWLQHKVKFYGLKIMKYIKNYILVHQN